MRLIKIIQGLKITKNRTLSHFNIKSPRTGSRTSERHQKVATNEVKATQEGGVLETNWRKHTKDRAINLIKCCWWVKWYRDWELVIRVSNMQVINELDVNNVIVTGLGKNDWTEWLSRKWARVKQWRNQVNKLACMREVKHSTVLWTEVCASMSNI